MPLITESVGRVLGGRYRLVSALGTGASAHVFLAEDVTLQRLVAVKVLQPALSRDPAFLKRFSAEARSAASLNHPHVLRVFDWGEDADGPYLVAEYLGGGSLRDVLDRGTLLTPAQAAALGREVADGLAYAHARGLVHRDVKPANLLFDEEGRVRVADFGVARALAESAYTEPDGAIVGTARYASPEQAEGRPVDGRSDVYSLALVLYESVTGTVPFVADTTVATLMARVGARVPPHASLGPLQPVLEGAADPEAARRPDARDLARQLSAVGDTLPPPAPLLLNPPARPPGAPTGLRAAPGEVFDVEALEVADTAALPLVGPGDPASGARPAAGPGTMVAPPPPAPSSGAAPRRGRPARSHRGRWVAALAVVLALALAGGAVYAVRTKLFTPSRHVPSLSGMTLAAARRALAARHLDASVGTPVYATTRAAGLVVRQHPAPGALVKEGTVVALTPSKGPPPVTVPSLAQLTCATALRLLAVSHLGGTCPPAAEAYSATVPDGQVISWSYGGRTDPTVAPYGAVVGMAVSKGPPPVAVASVAGSGSSYASAAATLQGQGLVATESKQYSTTVPAGQVVGTDPPAGTTVPHGSAVTVVVSAGPPYVTVPDVVGDPVGGATAALQKDGLAVGQVYGPPDARVFATDPAVGSSVQEGTTVNLYTE